MRGGLRRNDRIGRGGGRGARCRARRDTRGKRGYDGSGRAGMTELFRAGVREAGAGLGAELSEIPAASAGMTDLFARAWRVFFARL